MWFNKINMPDGFINILIAEDNDVSRDMMTGILRAEGYNIFGAINGESAIKVVNDRDIDLALVDVNMAPTGGFEFVKYVVSKGLGIPVVIITGDDSADLLMEASSLGVAKVIQKPVIPDRLIFTVQRILKRKGLNPTPLAVQSHETKYTAEELMDQTIELAAENARAKRGGPFAALVATKDGQVLGTGANGRPLALIPPPMPRSWQFAKPQKSLENRIYQIVFYTAQASPHASVKLWSPASVSKMSFMASRMRIQAASRRIIKPLGRNTNSFAKTKL